MYSENFKKAFAESMDERMIIPFLDVPDYQFPKKFERKMQSLFKHPFSYIIAKNRMIPLRKIIIYIIISSMLLTLSFTTAAYWEEVKSFFMEIFSDHTRVTNITEDDFPKTIEDIYTPEYIPSGFILQENEVNKLSTYSYYKSESEYFSFEQNIKNVAINVNSELSDIEIINVDGYDGYYLQIENTITFIWVTDKYTFMIIGDISKDEVIKIAKSVTSEKQ